ncbi:serine--tRNA ligase, mitochondrial [Condylostylus longicornis]|uniref:serine--tRNA ligase, mitochondrial n=1 Tax=Condylostylus longicornis TaxID=2530218 RepID=UPI00244DC028|nr:serine--tRNA ligase, mitochondrial [Condylostylus longicornis]
MLNFLLLPSKKKILKPLTAKVHQLIKEFLPPLSSLDNYDFTAIENNIKLRKTTGDLELIKSLLKKLQNADEGEKERLMLELKSELWKLPNQTHADCLNYKNEPKEIAQFNKMPNEEVIKTKEFSEIAKKMRILRTEHLGNFTGHKSYYLIDSLAEIEHALIRFATNYLKSKNFNIISVPDVLPSHIIEGCGMQTVGKRTQVYRLNSLEKCLSGTSEMALAGYFKDKILKEEDLPIKLASVSRCFRAETSGLQEEKGIYRVHQFTKVEMFSVCSKDQSDNILNLFKNIQIELFAKLGIHFKLLDMPPSELGAPAYRKYDIEAWLPGRKIWGEISSCSNCTDYQAKRLGIHYKRKDNTLEYVHTVNGTACAVPRLLIALLETHQNKEGSVQIPKELQIYLNKNEICKNLKVPELKLVKQIDWPNTS